MGTTTTRPRKRKPGKDLKPPDYDSAWKEVIEEHFEPFIEFFFPEIHKDIDFSRPIELLSNDLKRIIPSGKVGKRHVDILVKVFLKGAQSYICVFIHIEIQGTGKTGFMKRIFVYYYRIYEKYSADDVEIVSLAMLTDEGEK